jgi:hypothetical protein
VCAVLAALCLGPQPAIAAGLVETNVYSVTGVEVDVTDTDASTAKTKAIIEAYTKAFFTLARRAGSEADVQKMKDLKPEQIGRLLKSLSIEEERTGPGRYIGKLTIRFLPAKTRATLAQFGISGMEDQSPAILLVPVWRGPEGPQLWEDNVWRKAWINLHAEQSAVPLIVPLGDLDDTRLIDAEQAMNGDEGHLEGLRLRYEAKAVRVAIAEPDGDVAIRAVMEGETPLGKVEFDNVYTAEGGDQAASAALAVQRFHSVMIEKWRGARAKIAADARARADIARAEKAAVEAAAMADAPVQALSVSVPFSSASEWGQLRQRILSTAGVTRVEVSSLAGNGAQVRLSFKQTLAGLQAALLGSRLRMRHSGGGWVLEPI